VTSDVQFPLGHPVVDLVDDQVRIKFVRVRGQVCDTLQLSRHVEIEAAGCRPGRGLLGRRPGCRPK